MHDGPKKIEETNPQGLRRKRTAMHVFPGSEVERTYWLSGTDDRDALRNFLSGSLSGFVCKTFEYPFDTVKTLQQTQGKAFKGPIDALQKTIQKDGFFALYKGLPSPLVGAIFENALVFSAYGQMQKWLGVEPNKWSHPLKYATAGFLAGLVAATILTPIELVKCNLQVAQEAERAAISAATKRGETFVRVGEKLSTPYSVVKEVIMTKGIRGMYRGHSACLLRELPGNFAWFGTYEFVLRGFANMFGYKTRDEVPLVIKAMSGSFGGVAYWAVPFPFDTIKSMMQTDPLRFKGKNAPRVFFEQVRRHGILPLYKGIVVTCMRAAPAHFLIFFSYEWAAKFLLRF